MKESKNQTEPTLKEYNPDLFWILKWSFLVIMFFVVFWVGIAVATIVGIALTQ